MEQGFKDLIEKWDAEANNEEYEGHMITSNAYFQCIDDLKSTLQVIEANKLI